MPAERTALERARTAVVDGAMAARAIACLDLTSLGETDDEAVIRTLAVRASSAGVAAVCVWPAFVPVARAVLAGSTVRVATVANFPDGGDDIGRAVAETAAAVAAGADEVDVVAPLQAVLDGDIGLVSELVEATRAVLPAGKTLKLILETGLLAEPSVLTAAARAAVMAGVDMLKTSTGKRPVGATLEAAAVLLDVIAEADGRVGLKVAGGVRTAAEAAAYLALCDARMGGDWATRQTFRIGASSLLDGLLAVR